MHYGTCPWPSCTPPQDLLSAFNGSWHIEPLSLDLPDSPKAGAHQHQQHRQEESGTAAADGTHDGSAVVQAHAGVVRGARVVLNQDVSPKGESQGV